jgi:hypothetical protein
MNAGEVKQTARDWVAAQAGEWPGLRAAHLLGSITTTDQIPFPSYKDVDLHLIFEATSPLLLPQGPFAKIYSTRLRPRA